MISAADVLRTAKSGVLTVKARPSAPKTEITGIEGAVIKISIKAPPENNKANKELVKFLSKLLNFQVVLISGGNSRLKRVRISE